VIRGSRFADRTLRRWVLMTGAMLVGGCALFYPIGEKVDSEPEAGTAGAAGSDHPACGTSDKPCPALQTAECPVVYPSMWNDPHAVFLGAYAALVPDKPENSDLVWTYELAVKEFNDQGGLPDTNGMRHTLVMVICNNDAKLAATDLGFLSRSLDHLTDVVGVAAIVADLPPKDLIGAFKRTQGKGKDVFFLSPGPANNELAGLMDDGRVWSMLGLPVDLAPAYKALLKRIETYIRSIDREVGMLRVALVKSSDPNEPRHEQLGELIDALTRTTDGSPNPNVLEFNSTNLAANLDADYYREYDVARASPAAIGDEIRRWQPHVVISMTGPAFTHFAPIAEEDGVADTIESGATDWRYPFFMLSPVNASAWPDIVQTIKSVSQKYADVHRRFLGIDVATADDPTLYYDYLNHLRTLHPDAREGTENYYDPIYYMAYAMYHAGVDGPVSGEGMLAGMLATLAGVRYDVGPRPIPKVFEALQPGKQASIKLVGTMGEPNFDRTGTRVNRAALYCFASSMSQTPTQQAQVYEGENWVGDFKSNCYPEF